MIAGESPGSIRNQVGRSLNSVREAIDQGDVLKVADHLALLVAISAPKLSPEQMRAFAVPEISDKRDRDGTQQARLFRACMKILAELLCALSSKGLYAYNESEYGDGSSLALGGEEAAA